MSRKPKPARGKAFGILNPYGDLWTYRAFETEAEAHQFTKDFWRDFPRLPRGHDLRDYKVVPVRVTVSVLPTKAGTTGVSDEVPGSPHEPSSNETNP